MIGEFGLRIDSIEVRFDASDKVLSERMCFGSSGTMESARLWRVLGVSDVFVDVRDRVAVLLLALAVLVFATFVTDSRFFFAPKGATLPKTPVTPPKSALPPPATSFGALDSTLKVEPMPLPMVSKVLSAQSNPGKPAPGVLPVPSSFSRKRFIPSLSANGLYLTASFR